MRSLAATYMRSLAFSSSQLSTLKLIGEHRGRQALYSRQSPEALKTLLQAAIVESSESSSRMEGVTAPRSRIQALVRGGAAPRNRSEQEITGYRDALALIHENAPSMRLSCNLLLQLHGLLYRYLPGEGGRWKMTDNTIVERAPDGTIRRVRFRPVSAVQTPLAMEGFVSGYAEATDRTDAEPLIIVPLTVLDFLCIHPFTDGNGRISRLLTLLLLYQSGYEVGRYISLERIFEETKETYYETLEASSQGWHEGRHGVFPWMNYF
jgi:Fic family protein